MFVKKALDFSVFPSILLVGTLFRLALNVASVRLVLLHGDAGRVIEAFGHVVIGGSVVVGLIAFAASLARTFRTPALEPGREYEYTVRAVIEIDGRQEVETRQVTVVAGEISRASFETLFAKVEANGRSLVVRPNR